jgi:hypothetical protein
MKTPTKLTVFIGSLAFAISALAECLFATYEQCLKGTTGMATCSSHGPFPAPITDHGIRSLVYPSGDPNQGMTGYTESSNCHGATAGQCPACGNYGTGNPDGPKNQWTTGQCCPVG